LHDYQEEFDMRKLLDDQHKL